MLPVVTVQSAPHVKAVDQLYQEDQIHILAQNCALMKRTVPPIQELTSIAIPRSAQHAMQLVTLVMEAVLAIV